jgi:hypothetical protein
MRRRLVRPGDVLEFHYTFHDPIKLRFGKLRTIRDLTVEPLSSQTLERHPERRRSRYLLTCLMGDGTYRAFYHRGLTEVKRIGILRRAFLSLSGIKFDEATDDGVRLDEVVEVG